MQNYIFSLLPGKGKKMQNNFVKERGTRNRRPRSEFGNKSFSSYGKTGLGVFDCREASVAVHQRREKWGGSLETIQTTHIENEKSKTLLGMFWENAWDHSYDQQQTKGQKAILLVPWALLNLYYNHLK